MALVGLIMAGGIGTRMKSATNKLLHPILGREVIRFPVESLREGGASRAGRGASQPRNAQRFLPGEGRVCPFRANPWEPRTPSRPE